MTGLGSGKQDNLRRHHVEESIAAVCGKADHTSTNYDSVVIVGDEGITTGIFAARLARDPKFAGKVTIAGGRVSQDPMLRNGVSLRGSAADYIIHALDSDLATFMETASPGRTPIATRQTVCMAAPRPDGYELSRVGPWQNHSGRSERPIVIGFRNSATVAAITSLSADVIRVDESPTDIASARNLANGNNPLVVDATKAGLIAGRDKAPGWGIAVAQAPFTRTSGVGPLEEETTLAPLVYREGRVDVGYYTPFADPLSPEANWYGILARPVRVHDEKAGREHELASLRKELLGIADACGLTGVNLDETLGAAWVPAPSWKAPKPSANGVFDIRRACTPGIAAYYADGMAGAAIAGVSAAEAIIRGKDPLQVANAALHPFRRWNQIWWFETVKIPWVVDKLTRLSPQVALSWPHSTSVNAWASVA